LEDQLRAAIALYEGLRIVKNAAAPGWKAALDGAIKSLFMGILSTERVIGASLQLPTSKGYPLLVGFLMSFASRSSSRERLHIFTTNYDRLIEHGCDLLGVRVLDRFIGALSPEYRSSRQTVDYHYNPPGIRGEPRYLESVIRFTKLHGSIDWRFQGNRLHRCGLPFGADDSHSETPAEPFERLMVYPNPAKDVETLYYPYADLFRDFAAATCQPNSSLVTYGYGFGDDHVNRVILDMMTIPSTHLVIVSYDHAEGRVMRFCERLGRDAQVSLLVGNHFGNLKTLVENYLPKPAIDLISSRKAELLKARGEVESNAPPGAEKKENTDNVESD
jgi:hypothetical protein